MLTIVVAGLLLILGRHAEGHIYLVDPPARGAPQFSQYHPTDYNLMAPAQAVCQGKPAGPIAKTVRAGEVFEITFWQGATHGGGGCQFSLSYDEGKTFTVIETTDGACPTKPTERVRIPDDAPPCERCVLAWSWIPVWSGRPEYYMNCVDIKITSGNLRGLQEKSLAQGEKLQFYNFGSYPSTRVPFVATTYAAFAYGPAPNPHLSASDPNALDDAVGAGSGSSSGSGSSEPPNPTEPSSEVPEPSPSDAPEPSPSEGPTPTETPTSPSSTDNPSQVPTDAENATIPETSPATITSVPAATPTGESESPTAETPTPTPSEEETPKKPSEGECLTPRLISLLLPLATAAFAMTISM